MSDLPTTALALPDPTGIAIGRTEAPLADMVAKAKPASKAKVAVVRLPAETFLATIAGLNMSKGQAAVACSVSPSLVSEWAGFGRKTLMNSARWPEAQKPLAAYAKKATK